MFLGVAANQKETVVAEAATTQTHIRVYAFLETPWKYPLEAPMTSVFIHYWGADENNPTWAINPSMTLIKSNYYSGLFLLRPSYFCGWLFVKKVLREMCLTMTIKPTMFLLRI